MIESQLDIDQTLEIAGDILTFEFGLIKGILGFEVILISGYEGPNDIELQKYSVQISTKDWLDNNIELGQTFTYGNFGKFYTFKIEKAIESMLGWMELKISLLRVEKL